MQGKRFQLPAIRKLFRCLSAPDAMSLLQTAKTNRINRQERRNELTRENKRHESTLVPVVRACVEFYWNPGK